VGIDTCIHTDTCTYMCLYVCICICMFAYIYTFNSLRDDKQTSLGQFKGHDAAGVHMNIYVYSYIYNYIYVMHTHTHTYTHKYTYTYSTCMYTHTYTHTQRRCIFRLKRGPPVHFISVLLCACLNITLTDSHIVVYKKNTHVPAQRGQHSTFPQVDLRVCTYNIDIYIYLCNIQIDTYFRCRGATLRTALICLCVCVYILYTKVYAHAHIHYKSTQFQLKVGNTSHSTYMGGGAGLIAGLNGMYNYHYYHHDHWPELYM